MMGSSPAGRSHVSVITTMSRSLSVMKSEITSAFPSLQMDCALKRHSFRLGEKEEDGVGDGEGGSGEKDGDEAEGEGERGGSGERVEGDRGFAEKGIGDEDGGEGDKWGGGREGEPVGDGGRRVEVGG